MSYYYWWHIFKVPSMFMLIYLMIHFSPLVYYSQSVSMCLWQLLAVCVTGSWVVAKANQETCPSDQVPNSKRVSGRWLPLSGCWDRVRCMLEIKGKVTAHPGWWSVMMSGSLIPTGKDCRKGAINHVLWGAGHRSTSHLSPHIRGIVGCWDSSQGLWAQQKRSMLKVVSGW